MIPGLQKKYVFRNTNAFEVCSPFLVSHSHKIIRYGIFCFQDGPSVYPLNFIIHLVKCLI